jgi:uncharacterized repeat protein (TIGR01451 family)
MHKQFYSVTCFFISLLLSIGIGIPVNGQTVEQYRENITNGGDGTTATLDEILQYTVTTTNTTSTNITNSAIYSHIPVGTIYVPGSTKVNGVSVPDVNGKMPFGSGGLINSPTSGPGILTPNTAVEIQFSVKVGGSYGSFTFDATLKGTTTSGTILVKSDPVYTNIIEDIGCNTIYQSTTQTNFGAPPTYLNRYIKQLDTENGTAGSTIFVGAAGSVLADAEAMGYSRATQRIYFINNTTNNPAQDLCYLDLTLATPAVYKFVGYPLETNTGTGYNINRMTFAADGYGYALTANAQDLIRFSINPSTSLPVISPLGPLVNDVNNGTNDVLTETGGDMFGDASGQLYLIPNSGKLYRIDPATRVTVYLGSISGMPAGGVTGVAVSNGYEVGYPTYVYIGGAYMNVYRADLATMSIVQLNSSTSNVWKTGDYTSCLLAVLAPALNVTKTYTNTSGASYVRAGDPIEYTIEVTNTGNISAALVKLYDAIPANSYYIANSTTMNGVAVADIGGAMPFSVSGGQFINSSSESTGIVKVGDANKVVIKFRIKTEEYKTICNLSTVTFPDAGGNTIHVYSDDPTQSGTLDPTCFYSDKGLISIQASKTYFNTTTGHMGDLAGDPIEYTIEVTNSGIMNATGVKLYDAIPAFSHYIENTTTMNGVPVSDIGGLMPFSVIGGQSINSSAELAGVVAPGVANKVVIKFRITTDANKPICNQATVSFTDANGNAKNVITDDPTQSGTQDATCFFSYGSVGEGRVAVNGTLNENQSVPGLLGSVQVRPNPFVNNLNLQVQLNTAETIQVRLIDFYGRTVYTTSRNLGAGVNSLNLHVPAGLSRGIYVLELSAGNNRLLNKKLIKQ